MLIALILTAIFVGVVVRLAKGWRSFWDRQPSSEDWMLGTLIALFAQVRSGWSSSCWGTPSGTGCAW